MTYSGSEEGFTNCPDCGREYTTQFAAYSEALDGYGTHTEYYPQDKKCPGCKGEADCDWCDSTEASTFFVERAVPKVNHSSTPFSLKEVDGDLCKPCKREALEACPAPPAASGENR